MNKRFLKWIFRPSHERLIKECNDMENEIKQLRIDLCTLDAACNEKLEGVKYLESENVKLREKVKRLESDRFMMKKFVTIARQDLEKTCKASARKAFRKYSNYMGYTRDEL